MSAADRAVSAKRMTYWVLLGCIPAFALGLWLASGRGVWTQRVRYVSVSVTDTLFGDTTQVQQAVPGPIHGYYVGLDVVVAAALLAMAIASTVALVKLLARRLPAGKEPS
jgi:hypothetical protein